MIQCDKYFQMGWNHQLDPTSIYCLDYAYIYICTYFRHWNVLCVQCRTTTSTTQNGKNGTDHSRHLKSIPTSNHGFLKMRWFEDTFVSWTSQLSTIRTRHHFPGTMEAGWKILRSQSRLRYIADRVLQSSSDMFQKNKDESRWKMGAQFMKNIGISNLLGIQSSSQNMIGCPISFSTWYLSSAAILTRSLYRCLGI